MARINAGAKAALRRLHFAGQNEKHVSRRRRGEAWGQTNIIAKKPAKDSCRVGGAWSRLSRVLLLRNSPRTLAQLFKRRLRDTRRRETSNSKLQTSEKHQTPTLMATNISFGS